MIGFVQTVPNNISGFSGFAMESLENVLVRVFDQNGQVVEGAFVTLNTATQTTNSEGFVEYEATGAYTIHVFSSQYSVFTDSGVIVGNSAIDVVLTSLFASAVNAIDSGALLWSPIVNSFKFINKNDASFLDNESLDDLNNEDYMWGAGYCQIALAGETRQIQFHSNGTGLTVEVYDYFTLALITSEIVTLLASATKPSIDGLADVDYNIYQSDVLCPLEGTYFIKIQNAELKSINSEPFVTLTNVDNYLNMEFQNDENTENNVWKQGYIPRIRIQAQLYKRQMASERTIFKGSDDYAQVLSVVNSRSITMESFQLPPYMHEMIAVGISGSKFRMDNQEYISEGDYSSPTYIDRFSLANGSVTCKTSKGMKQQIDATVTSPSGSLFISDNLDNNISDANDNLIIQP